MKKSLSLLMGVTGLLGLLLCGARPNSDKIRDEASSPLEKGTGTSRGAVAAATEAPRLGASPLSQRTASLEAGGWVPGELIVAFREAPTPSSFGAVVGALPANASWGTFSHAVHAKGQPGTPHPLSRVRVIRGLGDVDIPALADVVAALPGVAYAEPNYIAHMALVPDDPLYDQQYGPQIIEAEAAWDITTGDASVVLAIIDSGLNFPHEDFQDGALWVNDDPPNGVDDDGNGYVDDTNGWDFGHEDAYPEDTDGHGSHVAGIAAARLNNGVGMAGLGNSTIMPLLVFVDGSAPFGVLAEAIYYAADNGATVMNFSGGSSYDADVVREACQYALDHGVLLVAAAGNDNSGLPFFPAAYNTTIAVSGTDAQDNRYTSSNYGNHMDVSAPAVGVYSAVAGDPDAYEFYNGTSMAAPHVTGVIGLMYALKPNLTPEQVRFVIQRSADDIGQVGFDPYFGWGRLNAHNALLGVINMIENTMPDSFAAVRGQHFMGGVADLFQSDDQRVTFMAIPRRSAGDAPVRMVVEGTAPVTTPAALEYTLETTTYSPRFIMQRIELFNYVSGSYETIDVRKAKRTDTAVTIVVAGDPARFIEPGTLKMRAQLSWRNADPTLIPNWLIGVDHAVWSVTP